MTVTIGRRELLAALGGAAAAWPLAAWAQQQPGMPVIGFLSSRSPRESASVVAGFRQGLKEAGYREGQNVHIAFRWAEGQFDQLPALAAELVEIQVAVILAAGGTVTGLAAKEATSTIPIVCIGTDPDRVGLVASLSRPGGNVTGISPLSWPLGAKRLGLLRELVPRAAVIAVLINPNSPVAEMELEGIQAAARATGQQIHILHASSESGIDAAFTNLVQQRVGALLVGGDPFFDSRRNQLVALAARHAVPTIYSFSAAGGLISYASNIPEAYRQAAIYVGRILKGEKASDLPVVQPTKFELIINLKTAKALGIDVPLHLQQLADEVIE
jgi:putative ABC transport system substrate-binding protein